MTQVHKWSSAWVCFNRSFTVICFCLYLPEIFFIIKWVGSVSQNINTILVSKFKPLWPEELLRMNKGMVCVLIKNRYFLWFLSIMPIHLLALLTCATFFLQSWCKPESQPDVRWQTFLKNPERVVLYINYLIICSFRIMFSNSVTLLSCTHIYTVVSDEKTTNFRILLQLLWCILCGTAFIMSTV